MRVVGTTLFAGGIFTLAGGQPRNNIAAFNTTTGALTTWDANVDGWVMCMVAKGSRLYIGGNFTTAGGQFRANAANLGVANGLASSWAPDPNGVVYAIAVSGSKVYLGGEFTNVSGQPHEGLAVVDGTTAVVSGTFAPFISNRVLCYRAHHSPASTLADRSKPLPPTCAPARPLSTP